MSGGEAIIAALEAAEPVQATAPEPAAARKPQRRRAQAPEAGPDPGAPDPAAETLDLACAELPLTDLGNARRFLARHGEDFLYVPEWGWLAWDGRRWARAGADGLVARAVHDTVFRIADEAEALAHSGRDAVLEEKKGRPVYLSDRIRGWCLASQGAGHVRCVAELARADLEAATGDFDADPMMLNALNGTLVFARRDEADYVELRPHARGDRITKLAGVAYDPAAEAPVYDAALGRVQPAAEVRRHLHCWAGLSLTGDVSEQKMAFWYGKGRNMKSTLLAAWRHVAGDYAGSIGVESFLDQGRPRTGREPSPDLAALAGLRMLATSEPERGAKLAEGLIKTVTGEEIQKVRELNRPPFDLVILFKLVMFGNYKPEIRGTDEGIWRRVVFVPFETQVPKAELDRELLAKLKREGAGVLNRMLDGLRDYLDHGLVVPDAIASATEQFREETDVLQRFLDACTEPDDGGEIQSTELYRLYAAWCVANGEKRWTHTGFSRALREKGVKGTKSSVTYFRGLRAVAAVADFVANYEVERIEDFRPRRGAGRSRGRDSGEVSDADMG